MVQHSRSRKRLTGECSADRFTSPASCPGGLDDRSDARGYFRNGVGSNTLRHKGPTARRWGADERFHGRGRRLGGWRPRPFCVRRTVAAASHRGPSGAARRGSSRVPCPIRPGHPCRAPRECPFRTSPGWCGPRSRRCTRVAGRSSPASPPPPPCPRADRARRPRRRARHGGHRRLLPQPGPGAPAAAPASCSPRPTAPSPPSPTWCPRPSWTCRGSPRRGSASSSPCSTCTCSGSRWTAGCWPSSTGRARSCPPTWTRPARTTSATRCCWRPPAVCGSGSCRSRGCWPGASCATSRPGTRSRQARPTGSSGSAPGWTPTCRPARPVTVAVGSAHHRRRDGAGRAAGRRPGGLTAVPTYAAGVRLLPNAVTVLALCSGLSGGVLRARRAGSSCAWPRRPPPRSATPSTGGWPGCSTPAAASAPSWTRCRTSCRSASPPRWCSTSGSWRGTASAGWSRWCSRCAWRCGWPGSTP